MDDFPKYSNVISFTKYLFATEISVLQIDSFRMVMYPLGITRAIDNSFHCGITVYFNV